MATFSSISTTSGSPTTIYADANDPINVIVVHNDSASASAAHVVINGETKAEHEVTIMPGILLPIRRESGITKVTAYATSGAVNLYTAIIDK